MQDITPCVPCPNTHRRTHPHLSFERERNEINSLTLTPFTKTPEREHGSFKILPRPPPSQSGQPPYSILPRHHKSEKQRLPLFRLIYDSTDPPTGVRSTPHFRLGKGQWLPSLRSKIRNGSLRTVCRTLVRISRISSLLSPVLCVCWKGEGVKGSGREKTGRGKTLNQ